MPTYKQIEQELRDAALAYPGAYEESPWGDRVTKVKGKIFLFAGARKDGFSFTTKLPQSGSFALSFPFAQPTHYGLGKHGWVTASFKAGQEEEVPVPLLYEWLDESYRAVAPKTMVKELDAKKGEPTTAPVKKKAKPKKSAKKGTVLLVGDDDLRLARAKKALGAGVKLASPDDDVLGSVARKPPAAIVVDLGRRPDLALEVGTALARLERAPVVFAGARDAATVKKGKKVARACFKEPPGDERVLAELEAILEKN